MTLQALNDLERDEWMLTIQRLVEEGGYAAKNEEKLTPSHSFFSGVSHFFVRIPEVICCFSYLVSLLLAPEYLLRLLLNQAYLIKSA